MGHHHNYFTTPPPHNRTHNDTRYKPNSVYVIIFFIFGVIFIWNYIKYVQTKYRPQPNIIYQNENGEDEDDDQFPDINNYFPEAAHQVVMLSTDTEVDQELYQDLEPHLSHCYHLVYDADTGRTQAENNYFWKE